MLEGNKMTNAIHSPRWFRFHLRSLFIAVGLSSIALSYLSREFRCVHERHRVLSDLQRRHAQVTTWDEPFLYQGSDWGLTLASMVERPRTSWLRRLLGDQPINRITLLEPVRNSDQEQIAELFPEAGVNSGGHVVQRGVANNDWIHVAFAVPVFCFLAFVTWKTIWLVVEKNRRARSQKSTDVSLAADPSAANHDGMPNSSRRRWFQFRLTTWFVLVGILCWGLACWPWWTTRWEPNELSKAMTQAFAKVGIEHRVRATTSHRTYNPAFLWPIRGLMVFLAYKCVRRWWSAAEQQEQRRMAALDAPSLKSAV
jgi:hypothetical protein